MEGLTKKILSRSHSTLASDDNQSSNKEVLSDEPTIRNQLQAPHGRVQDPNMDPKKLKRVLASRQYSQKYRLKQLHYILQLETEVKALQAEVAITSPRIKYVDHQNSLLRIENGSMKQKLSAFSSDLMFKEAQYEELKKERDLLKQFYVVNQQQPLEFFKIKPIGNYQLLNMNLNHSAFNPFFEPVATVGVSQIMINQNLNQFGTGQIMNNDSTNFI
ncbi:hypothetical protein P3X46_028093 [Hevea brasiliensis]|uniref:Uncharacterized protein n=2 Tax=Hevea brasiliensis TaxID=3981 RepID=A0A6A6KNJ7_HEVBR|nr:basic leucine zipper 34-like [Hevea brasiliensis]KAF2290297.1 hypothetical protein GH714_009108 [Hevea brasiliensis]KAJ9145747.1 hypothetical protein P3X46_028093 [Hevea brasiliensis]